MISMTVGDVFTGIALIIAFIAVIIVVDKMLQEWYEADDEDFKDD
jgi:hypothetical protein